METYSYGTSGFRYNEDIMIRISERIGIAIGAVILSINHNTVNKYLGLMITASHNQYTDNGIKLINYDGDMIDIDEYPLLIMGGGLDKFVNVLRHLELTIIVGDNLSPIRLPILENLIGFGKNEFDTLSFL